MRESIDGASFAQAVIHAAASLNLRKQEINELNVFPVPDGDTGTNMSLTIGTAATELRKKQPRTVGEAASTTASALLRGARGNSGVILSLLFRGLSKAVKDRDTIDGRDLAIALDFGVAAAYKAVMKPAEGTILTVSRLAAKAAAEAAQEQNSAEHVLEAAIAHGQEALAETINQNPVLKKAGVVDAGGKGFLIILQGMLDEMRGIPAPQGGEDDAPKAKDKADFATFETGDITFGYCTEFICSRDNTKDPQLLRSFLNGMGDSLVLVDDDEIIKVHVHTNHPGRVLEEALTYGALLTVKIENMREQHTEILEEAKETQEEEPGIVPAEKKYGVVAVCAGGGLASVFRDLGVDGIISGGQTMNPSTEDLLEAVLATPAKKVFILPNNKNILMAAEQTVPLVTDREVVVIPTRTIPQGLSAMLAFDPDLGAEENQEAMLEAAGNVDTGLVTFAARDSEFGGHTIRHGDILGLKNGKLEYIEKDPVAACVKVTRSLSSKRTSFITLIYGEGITQEQAEEAKRRLEDKLHSDVEITLVAGGQPVYYFIVSVE